MEIKKLTIEIKIHGENYLKYKEKKQYKEAMEELEKLITILYKIIDYAEKNLTNLYTWLYNQKQKLNSPIKIEKNQNILQNEVKKESLDLNHYIETTNDGKIIIKKIK